MDAALALGRRGLGRVWPNPAVGCVVVDVDGCVAGRGWTQPGGRPHAETEALRRAGERARGGTVYVTLEPCSHHGRTPPCADALIAAGVARVVTTTGDPDPRVAGHGFERLAAAGITIDIGLAERQARFDQAGYLSRIEDGRPLFALKSAASLDGRIAAAGGDSKWITGPEARRVGHRLRASHDAVLVGVGTAIADDPRLDCRLDGLEDASPLRIVLDSGLRLPLALDLVQGARARPTWVVCALGAEAERRYALEEAGVRVIVAAAGVDGRVDPGSLGQSLAAEGLTRILVEGGGGVAATLLSAGMIDRIHAFRAPIAVGGDGVAAIGPLGLDRVADGPRFRRIETRDIDDDVAELYVRIAAF